jgi:hypothetical protein
MIIDDIKFDLNDIVIVPTESSDINSRSECDVNSEFNLNKFLPIIASPMDTVVSIENYKAFINNGIIPCLPRGIDLNRVPIDKRYYFQAYGLNEIEEQLHYIFHEGDIDLQRGLDKAFWNYPNILIDIANGHMSKLIPIIKEMKRRFPNTTLMVGNIANPKTFVNLGMAGADFVRCSIGTGAGCFVENTKIRTKNDIKNIQDINIGDKVLTHKGNYKEVINKISYIETNDLIEINKKNISTKDHKYYVLNKKYINIITDDNIENYAEWIEAEKLTNEYWLLENNI